LDYRTEGTGEDNGLFRKQGKIMGTRFVKGLVPWNKGKGYDAAKYLEVFLDRVNFIPFHECWQWIGSVNKQGYGLTYLFGKFYIAHRASWRLFNGEIPRGNGYHGTCVLHRCDNPSCVNPKHLFLGTLKDNNQDMIKKNRHTGLKKVIQMHRAITRCPRGHPYEGKNLIIQRGVFARRCRICTSATRKAYKARVRARSNAGGFNIHDHQDRPL
jgi:hypothetical protein